MLKDVYLRPSPYEKVRVALNHIFKYAIIHKLIKTSLMENLGEMLTLVNHLWKETKRLPVL